MKQNVYSDLRPDDLHQLSSNLCVRDMHANTHKNTNALVGPSLRHAVKNEALLTILVVIARAPPPDTPILPIALPETSFITHPR